MTIEQYRTKIKSSLWQSIAQSGADLKSVSTEHQNELVDVMTDNVLLILDDILDDASPQKTPKGAAEDIEGDETILWEGRPFMSLVEFYTITNERVKIVRGMLGKDVENFELIRVQDIDISQNFSERVLNIGDITICGADASAPQVILRNVHDPNGVYELLRKAWLAARKKYGLIFREEM